jgi:hypothetical protein
MAACYSARSRDAAGQDDLIAVNIENVCRKAETWA